MTTVLFMSDALCEKQTLHWNQTSINLAQERKHQPKMAQIPSSILNLCNILLLDYFCGIISQFCLVYENPEWVH